MYIIYEVIEELSENDLDYQYVRGKTLGYTKYKEVAEYYKNNYEDKYGNTCNYDFINDEELTIKELQEQMDYYTHSYNFDIKREDDYFKLISIITYKNQLTSDGYKKHKLNKGKVTHVHKSSKNNIEFNLDVFTCNIINDETVSSIENYYKNIIQKTLKVLKENDVRSTYKVIETLDKIK